MTEKIRCALYSIMGIALGIVLLLPGGHVQASEKKTIYNSSYVSFSPDGEAWTTCAGDRNYKWYDENETTTVYTGIKSSLETLREGEHYYKSSRSGEVPIGAWKVTWRRAQCIHNAYGKKPGWHGISFGMKKCHRYYYSGWKPLCADCGEPIEWWNIYIFVRFGVIWNRELHFHHTDVRQSQTISIGLPMMQMLSPAMALWKKAIICMIMLYFMREKK